MGIRDQFRPASILLPRAVPGVSIAAVPINLETPIPAQYQTGTYVGNVGAQFAAFETGDAPRMVLLGDEPGGFDSGGFDYSTIPHPMPRVIGPPARFNGGGLPVPTVPNVVHTVLPPAPVAVVTPSGTQVVPSGLPGVLISLVDSAVPSPVLTSPESLHLPSSSNVLVLPGRAGVPGTSAPRAGVGGLPWWAWLALAFGGWKLAKAVL